MIIKDLKSLIKELTEIYETEGNVKINVMRNGTTYPEIELNVSGDTLYIEAYKESEE